MFENQKGALTSTVLVAVLGLFLLGSLVFGIWAYMGRSDYKNHSDQKVADAVVVAKEEQKTIDEADFAEREKQPYETFGGPAEFGSIKIIYPKVWELYADVKTSSGAVPIDAYGHPGFVPGLQSDTAFALRFQILSVDYSSQLKQFENSAKNGDVTVSPFRAEKVSSVLGSRVDGKLSQTRTGSMVLLPVRDKTLKIWTESESYTADFNELLKNLSFAP